MLLLPALRGRSEPERFSDPTGAPIGLRPRRQALGCRRVADMEFDGDLVRFVPPLVREDYDALALDPGWARIEIKGYLKIPLIARPDRHRTDDPHGGPSAARDAPERHVSISRIGEMEAEFHRTQIPQQHPSAGRLNDKSSLPDLRRDLREHGCERGSDHDRSQDFPEPKRTGLLVLNVLAHAFACRGSAHRSWRHQQ
jgi:hypothetical protein